MVMPLVMVTGLSTFPAVSPRMASGDSTTFASTNIGYSYKDYEEKDPFLGLRSDKALNLRFGLTKIIDLCWNADIGVTFSSNKSTIGLYARSNEGIAVKFNYLCTE